MLKEAMEFLVGQRKTDPKIIDVYDHQDEKRVLIVKPDCTTEIETIGKPSNKNYSHEFYSLDSFCDFLTIKENCVVFVSNRRIRADLDYQGYYDQFAIINLDNSEEFNSYIKLQESLTQLELWELLQTKLSGMVEPGEELMMILASIDIKNTEQSRIEIDRTGSVNSYRAGGYS